VYPGEWRYRKKTVLEAITLPITGWMVALGLAAIADEVAAQRACPRVDLTLVRPSASAETRPVKNGDHTIFVLRNAITTIADIFEINVAGDDVDTLILIKYNAAAAARLLEATTDRDGQRMALVVDDDVVLAFTWEGPYGIGPDGTQLSLQDYGLARAQRLVEAIRSCAGPRAL
jgi:hypothetical protein